MNFNIYSTKYYTSNICVFNPKHEHHNYFVKFHFFFVDFYWFFYWIFSIICVCSNLIQYFSNIKIKMRWQSEWLRRGSRGFSCDLNPVENIKALLNLLFYIEHQTFRCFKDENQIKRTKNTIIAQINRKWYMKGT